MFQNSSILYDFNIGDWYNGGLNVKIGSNRGGLMESDRTSRSDAVNFESQQRAIGEETVSGGGALNPFFYG